MEPFLSEFSSLFNYTVTPLEFKPDEFYLMEVINITKG